MVNASGLSVRIKPSALHQRGISRRIGTGDFMNSAQASIFAFEGLIPVIDS
jgi:hypothetical protein